MAPDSKNPEHNDAKPAAARKTFAFAKPATAKGQTAGQAGTAEKKAPRRGVKNPFIYAGTVVILVITIVAFVFIPSIGGSANLGSSGVPSFGSWNGKPITYTSGSYFASQVAQINEYLRQQGLSEQNFQLYAYQVWRMAFQNTALRAAILDTTLRAGFKVTEAGLDEAVSKDATFQVDGQFSIETYNKTSKATIRSIRASTLDNLVLSRYYEDILSVSPSSAEIKFVADMEKPRRSISYFTIALSDFPVSEVKAWGEKNADLFRTFGLSRITVTSSEADAKKILQQVKDNKLSFEDAAKSHSQDAYADKGGDAGTQFYHTFADDFANKDDAAKVVALAKDEVSGVIKIADKTWAFFRMNSTPAAPDFTRQATLDDVRAYINEKERGTLESWAIAKATAAVGSTDGAAFAKTAAKAGFGVNSAGPFMLDLGNPSVYISYINQQIPLFTAPATIGDSVLQTAQQDEAFMTELFTTPKGKVSKPLVVGDSVVVFAVESDADAKVEDSSMLQLVYPYFHQQNLDNQVKTTYLASKKFKDDFNNTFFKVFNTSSSSSSSAETTTTTVAAPAQQ